MITASIVLYNEDIETLRKTVASFLNTAIPKKLYLIDNSPINDVERYFVESEIEYISTGKNLGFGKAHNLILNKIQSEYHLILNPDVVFNPDVIPNLISKLKQDSSISFITPKILYPNNSIQYVCRKHPTFFDLANRKLKLSKKLINNNEYRNQDFCTSFCPEFIHGCFMFFRTKHLKNLKGFDERFFLYMEDADICRRIDELSNKKMYYPKVEVLHQHQQGSSKSMKLFFRHTSSAIKYFLKWGF